LLAEKCCSNTSDFAESILLFDQAVRNADTMKEKVQLLSDCVKRLPWNPEPWMQLAKLVDDGAYLTTNNLEVTEEFNLVLLDDLEIHLIPFDTAQPIKLDPETLLCPTQSILIPARGLLHINFGLQMQFTKLLITWKGELCPQRCVVSVQNEDYYIVENTLRTEPNKRKKIEIDSKGQQLTIRCEDPTNEVYEIQSVQIYGRHLKEAEVRCHKSIIITVLTP